MDDKKKEKLFQWCGIGSLFLAGCVVLSMFPDTDDGTPSQQPTPEHANQSNEVEDNSDLMTEIISDDSDQTYVLVSELLERLDNQEKVDTMIQQEVESGYYSPENPLVILDPYSQSPLTALICFTTDVPTQVDIHIEGDDEYTEVNHSFSEWTTQHILPVYGLYPDKTNPVTVTVLDESGEVVARNVIEIQTEPLPDRLSEIIVITETFQEGYQEGINFLYSNGKTAFDKQGDIRWYLSKYDYLSVTDYCYENTRFLVALGGAKGTVLLIEIDKLGKVYSCFYSPYGVHHDIHDTKTTILALGADVIGDTIEDFIYEIDKITGNIVNTLDLKYVLQRSRPSWQSDKNYGLASSQDWLHLNSIDYDEENSSIVISGNYQSSVVKMDWPSGNIHWILGNHDDWNPRLEKYLLTPIGVNFEWNFNQHAAEILPDYDNNPETIDILLFDNGSTRFYQDEELQRLINNNDVVEPQLYSRLVHYRVNEKTMEVEQIWQYGKERGIQLFSRWKSDADLLENENILGLFNHDNDSKGHPILSEVTQQSELVWEAEFFTNSETGAKNEYRAERLPFYFDDDVEHDIYSSARNLIPEEIMRSVVGVELFQYDSLTTSKASDTILIIEEEFNIKANTKYSIEFSILSNDIPQMKTLAVDLYDGGTYDFDVNQENFTSEEIGQTMKIFLDSHDVSGVTEGNAMVRIMFDVDGSQENIELKDILFKEYS